MDIGLSTQILSLASLNANWIGNLLDHSNHQNIDFSIMREGWVVGDALRWFSPSVQRQRWEDRPSEGILQSWFIVVQKKSWFYHDGE